MTFGEFEHLSPSDLDDLYDVWEAKLRREDARFGLLAEIAANARWGTNHDPMPFKPWDFFPSLEPKVMTTDEIFQSACRIFSTPEGS